MTEWSKLAEDEAVEKTAKALQENGIEVFVVNNKEEAKKKVFEILPENAEVMTMSSVTINDTGIADEIENFGKYNSVRRKLFSMDKNAQKSDMKKLGAAPEWTIGSVHAVTEDGKIVVASATGSQLPAYAYGSSKVIFVVGTQKIVKNIDDAFKRIEEYTFPLEDARARKAYGVGSGINKLLIINKEVMPDRIKLIFVKEKLGF